MDNASNMDTFVDELAEQIPTFPGQEHQLRCLAHIINLIAKVMSIFTFI